MKTAVQLRLQLDDRGLTYNISPLETAIRYPQFRIMGSKYRLLPWFYEILNSIAFETALDAFSGSGCVAYLLKAMGKTVIANDFLQFAYHIANGLVANPGVKLSEKDVAHLLRKNPDADLFITRTFRGIFFTEKDLQFLDNIWANLQDLKNPYKRSMVLSALVRAAVKRQPRGVFTVGNEQTRKYNDGRRDLKLSLQEHFIESVEYFNKIVYDDGRPHIATCQDIFDLLVDHPVDLVYMDPPYVPRKDDNDYIKRYHFLEGLVCYWRGVEILPNSKVKKIKKKFTPFAYRQTSREAFDKLFKKFADSILVLSYSSNGYPDKAELVRLMKRYKRRVTVEEHVHRYHFGTHKGVRQERAVVREYLIIGE